jgi:SAM-dependent methyltransferase
MPDALFNDPRLAQIYDLVEGERDDLDHYLAMVAEFGAGSVLDVGCGTGIFACLLAGRGLEVVGVDPTAASLEMARARPGAERVTWVLGDATSLPELQVDLATMTGNVAQVFLTDEEWLATLRGVYAALRPGGHLVFETRNPEGRPWEKLEPRNYSHQVRCARRGRAQDPVRRSQRERRLCNLPTDICFRCRRCDADLGLHPPVLVTGRHRGFAPVDRVHAAGSPRRSRSSQPGMGLHRPESALAASGFRYIQCAGVRSWSPRSPPEAEF